MQRVADEHGSLNVLINNAGVNLDGNTYNAENARKTLDTNYRGTLHVSWSGTLYMSRIDDIEQMCQAFLPIMSKDGARIVNLSSVACELKAYSKEMQERFRDSSLTLDKLEAIAKEFEVGIPDSGEVRAI